MGFFKKLFTGIGFAAGFLFFGCLSVIVYASRGRHKPCHRRSSFWNTLERYLIFSWICDGVRSSRKRAEKSYYQRTGSDFWQCGLVQQDMQFLLHRPTVILTVDREFYICMDGANLFLHRSAQSFQFLLPFCFQLLCGLLMYFFGF